MFSHDHSSQKRKRKPANDENDNSQARSQKTNSSLGVVFEDVTNISRIQGNCTLLPATSLGMLKNRIRQTPRNLTSSIIQHGIESQISLKNPTKSATWGYNDTITSEDQGRILTSNSEVATPLKRPLGYQRKISHIQDNNMAPISIENTPPSNQSIPFKSIFRRVLKDITNTPQSVGFGSQVVQNRTIPSHMYGTNSQSPYVASTTTESGILCTPGVLSSSRYERFSSDQGKTSSQYQNSTINSRRSNYETTVIEPKRLFGIDDVNSGEDVVEGQYNQKYDLSTEESDAYSYLSSHGAHIFNSVEKFDFQAIIKRKKAQDAKKAENRFLSFTALACVITLRQSIPKHVKTNQSKSTNKPFTKLEIFDQNKNLQIEPIIGCMFERLITREYGKRSKKALLLLANFVLSNPI
ncbi:hypothetical protein YC2023_117570 [Brassica napus]